MSKDLIKGLNLYIDEAIHELCKVSNNASSNTRSVLYFIIVINILSLIAVLNTNRGNWINDRIDKSKKEIAKYRNKFKETSDSSYLDSVYYNRLYLEYHTKSKVENYHVVKLPIFGYLFDINDLGIVAGVTLVLLLIVLRFTIIREGSNLHIALHSITERYPPTANLKRFEKFIAEKSNDEQAGTNLLSEINLTRRAHHYNFLSMNEIFNFPPVKSKTTPNSKTASRKSKIAASIFWFPAVSYTVIFLNDLLTMDIGTHIQELHTLLNFSITVIFFFIIWWLCWRCVYQEGVISKLYIDFYNNGYSYLVQGESSE